MKRAIRAVALASLAVAMSCGGGGGGGAPSLAGAWRYVSGPAFSGPSSSEEDFEGTLRFLLLESDGTLQVILQDEASLTLFCHHGVYARTHDGVLMEIRRESEAVSLLFLRDQPDADTLLLQDAAGGTTEFHREAFVAPEFECQTLTVRGTRPGLVAVPTFFTGMAFDGTNLWFTDENETDVYPFNPATGVLGTPIVLDNSQYQMVHACEGTDFWLHCRCGGSEGAQRRTQADAFVDLVDTDVDLAEQISVRAIAFDNVADVLWLHGFGNDGTARFLKVNAAGEPDVLLQAADFDVSLRSMTWDGTDLWAITDGQNIVRVDVSTFQALATYGSPDLNVEWMGIASAPASVGGGNSLYLVGRDAAAGTGVIVEVQP